MQFSDLFRGYTSSHGVSKPRGTKDSRGKAEHDHFTRPGPPSPKEWSDHLAGTGSGIGIIPLMDDNSSVCWGAIDIDRYPLDYHKLEKDIEKLPLVMTKSKSGGAHLWLFMKEPTSAKLVADKLGEWASAIGWGTSEIFPKQHKRVVSTDVGNWINLPYFGETRKAFWKGEEVGLQTFLKLAAAKMLTNEQLENINLVSDPGTEGAFEDGPPCLQVLAKAGVPEGGRNNTLFNVGVYLRHKYPDDWRELLGKYDDDIMHPSLGPQEVSNTIKTLEKKAYNFSCSREPAKSHCNRALCKKRQFGVAFGSEGEELNVNLTGLTKYETTQPRWLINIDGIRADLDSTEHLLNQNKFGVICVEKVHKILRPVTTLKWREIVQELLENVEVIIAPPEASPEGQFMLYLREYIEKRKTDSKDQLAQGNVWVNSQDNKAYFRSEELFKYLRREGFRDLPQSKMFSMLHDRGMEKGRFNIKGATVAYWCIPVDKLQDEPFDVPDLGDKVFN